MLVLVGAILTIQASSLFVQFFKLRRTFLSLDNVKKISNFEDVQSLDENSLKSVAVSGVVRSLSPFTTYFRPDKLAVYNEISCCGSVELLGIFRDLRYVVTQLKNKIKPWVRETDWYLATSPALINSSKVTVEHAKNAQFVSALKRMGDDVQFSETSLRDVLLELFLKTQYNEVRITKESALLLDQQVTVIGEAEIIQSNMFKQITKIGQSKNGKSPFIITNRTLKDIKEYFRDQVLQTKILAVATGMCGLGIFLYKIGTILHKRRQQRRMEQLVRDQFRDVNQNIQQQVNDNNNGEDNQGHNNQRQCMVCGQPVDCIYTPCNHLCSCHNCAIRWLQTSNNCPVCSQGAAIQRVYWL